MEEFAATVRDASLRSRLDVALNGRRPFAGSRTPWQRIPLNASGGSHFKASASGRLRGSGWRRTASSSSAAGQRDDEHDFWTVRPDGERLL